MQLNIIFSYATESFLLFINRRRGEP